MAQNLFVSISFETPRNIMTELDLKLLNKKADEPTISKILRTNTKQH